MLTCLQLVLVLALSHPLFEVQKHNSTSVSVLAPAVLRTPPCAEPAMKANVKLAFTGPICSDWGVN